MAAYYKVEVSLGTNAVEVGIPSPQTVNVVLPLIGPAGPQGAAGAAGATGAQGPQGVPGTGLEVLTTQGDLLYQGAATGERLPIGTNGQVLKVSGGIPAWGAESGAVSSVAGRTGAVVLAVADVADAVATSDARLSDARTPAAHKSTHQTGGTDALTPADIGAATSAQGSLADSAVQPGDLATVATSGDYDDLTDKPTLGNSAALNVGTTTGTVAAGDDARLSDTRDPNLHAADHAASGGDPVFDQDLNTTDSVVFYAIEADQAVVTGDLFLQGGFEFDSGAGVTQIATDATATRNAILPDASGTIALLNDSSEGNITASDVSGLGTSATADIGTGAGEVAEGDHTHELNALDATGADDDMVLAGDGDGTASWRTIASVVDGNVGPDDIGAAHADHTHGNLTNDGKVGSTSGLPLVTTTAGAVTTLALGTAGQVLQVNSGATGVEFAAASGRRNQNLRHLHRHRQPAARHRLRHARHPQQHRRPRLR
jgi:hypothetical protein